MSRSGFRINKPAIKRLTRELQRELDRNPVHVRVETDPTSGTQAAAPTVSEPVVVNSFGDQAQIVVDSTDAVLIQGDARSAAPGYEQLACYLVAMLQKLPSVGLEPVDEATLRDSANEALGEVTSTEPDRSRVRDALAVLTGFLAPLAARARDGAGDAMSDFARSTIEHLGQSL